MIKKRELVINVRNFLGSEKPEIRVIIEQFLNAMLSHEQPSLAYLRLLEDYYQTRREKNHILWRIQESKDAIEFAKEGYEDTKEIYRDYLSEQEDLLAYHAQIRASLPLAQAKKIVSHQLNHSKTLLEAFLKPSGKVAEIPEDWEDKALDKLVSVEEELKELLDEKKEAYIKIEDMEWSMYTLAEAATKAASFVPVLDKKIAMLARLMALMTKEKNSSDTNSAAGVLYSLLSSLNLFSSVPNQTALSDMVRTLQNDSALKHIFLLLGEFTGHYQDKMRRLGHLVPNEGRVESRQLLGTLKEKVLALFSPAENYDALLMNLLPVVKYFKTDSLTMLHKRKYIFFAQCCKRRSTRSFVLADSITAALDDYLNQNQKKEETDCSTVDNDRMQVFFLKKQPEDRVNETFSFAQ
ncbi:MAG: hypothetical protein H2069_05820 [Legionella sp.]|nr:hypothetical protein [Legionella sp.]